LKEDIDTLALIFGEDDGSEPGLAGCMKEITRLRGAHLKELEEAEGAIWNVTFFMDRLKDELESAQILFLCALDQPEEKEEERARPSESHGSVPVAEFGIRKLMRCIDELGTELKLAGEQAAKIVSCISQAPFPQDAPPEVSVGYAHGLRLQLFSSYGISLFLLCLWLFGSE
jgi:hypothetical protein